MCLNDPSLVSPLNELLIRDPPCRLEMPDGVHVLRLSLAESAYRQEQILRKNDHKSGWENCTFEYLMKKFFEEFEEFVTVMLRFAQENEIINESELGSLWDSFRNHNTKIEYIFSQIRWKYNIGQRADLDEPEREGADVQNIVMMLLDNLKRWKK